MGTNLQINLYKIAFSLLLALILVGPGMFKIGFIAYFHINRQNITEEHCVNKDRPELKCNGQCFFMQAIEKIKEQERERESTIPNFIYQLEIPVFLSKNSFSPISLISKSDNQRNFMYSDMHSKFHFSRLLKPPQEPILC